MLDSGLALRFNDPRRFGSLLYTDGALHRHPLLKDLAPEPLRAAFDTDYLWRITRGRRVSIKQLLMNSHLVVGVGNIYASEALFRARIRPRRRRASSCRAPRRHTWCARCARSCGRPSAPAARRCVTTCGADGSPGYFRQRLYVYERRGKPCRRCGTPVRGITQGQRSTYYCPSCQSDSHERANPRPPEPRSIR